MGKGRIPADVLLVGEAPGQSENILGQPFVGPAGKLLGRIVDDAQSDSGKQLTLFWTNLVGCMPVEEETLRKRGEPLPDEIQACRPRLDELMKLIKPKLIVAVGGLAEKEAKAHGWEGRASVVAVVHPAAIMRMDISQRGLAIQRCVVQLSDAFGDL